MPDISPVELQKLLVAYPGLPVLDVRTPVEFAGEHVPSARNVPLDRFNPAELYAPGGLSPARPVYLLCRSGARAARAADKLAAAGFKNSVVVTGGTLGWIAAGLPVDRRPIKVISLERQVRIVAGSLVLTGVLLAHFMNPWFIGLSAFVGAGLVFAGITDFCGMGLLLARLPWNSRKPG